MRTVKNVIFLFLISSLTFLIGCGSVSDQALLHDDFIEQAHLRGQILTQWTHSGEFYESPVLRSEKPHGRMGLMLGLSAQSESSDPVFIWARGKSSDGEVTLWQKVSWTWIEHPQRVGFVDMDFASVEGQIRIHEDDVALLDEVTWSLLTPKPVVLPTPVDGISGTHVSVKHQALDSFFSTNGVISREEWNARDASGCGIDSTERYRMAVHHTAGNSSSNGDYSAKLRSTQSYHMDTRGWCDIGYHFLVTYDGSTWEGREGDYRGAHVGDQNSGNIGVSFVGCFHDDDYCEPLPPNLPSDIMITNGGLLIGLISEYYGITVDETHVKGHRDHDGASTSCPGNHLYDELATLRAIATGDTIPTVDADAGPSSLGQIFGVVWDLSLADNAADSDDARLTDAVVSCSCGEEVSVTGSGASWSFELPAGTYTFTASAPGYENAQAAVTVIAGEDVWNSFGLLPIAMGATDAGPALESENNDSGNEAFEDEVDPENENENEEREEDEASEMVLIPAHSKAEDGCSCRTSSSRSSPIFISVILWGLLFLPRRKR